MSQQILAKSHLNHIANKYDLHWGGRGRVSNDEALSSMRQSCCHINIMLCLP
ncbi:hypothetical protein AYX15_06953 [Cryptococcus neoformans]|nr:hypothetical protein AYX15_06953 [Cryptococcus neoformans var. grubii]